MRSLTFKVIKLFFYFHALSASFYATLPTLNNGVSTGNSSDRGYYTFCSPVIKISVEIFNVRLAQSSFESPFKSAVVSRATSGFHLQKTLGFLPETRESCCQRSF